MLIVEIFEIEDEKLLLISDIWPGETFCFEILPSCGVECNKLVNGLLVDLTAADSGVCGACEMFQSELLSTY